jgi:N-acetylmuramoyl-L-alanine amidase
VRNYLDPGVHRFRGNDRRGRPVTEFVIHETVTRSVAETVAVLKRRGLSVHLILGSDGGITQHGDLAHDVLWHASQHNPPSVGVEVVNPYYPKYLRPGLPWSQSIPAGWAHEGRYLLPTPPQAEAVARLTGWLTSPAAQGLSISRTWVGLSGRRLAMGRAPGADRPRPGIYAHTYFGHADGPWLVLYAWLRIEGGRPPQEAYQEAIRLGSTRNRWVTLP